MAKEHLSEATLAIVKGEILLNSSIRKAFSLVNSHINEVFRVVEQGEYEGVSIDSAGDMHIDIFGQDFRDQIIKLISHINSIPITRMMDALKESSGINIRIPKSFPGIPEEVIFTGGQGKSFRVEFSDEGVKYKFSDESVEESYIGKDLLDKTRGIIHFYSWLTEVIEERESSKSKNRKVS